LLGGTLFITVASEEGPSQPSFGGVLMRGPARTVFEAEIDPHTATNF
jgi:hypothetical protein